MSHRDRAGDEPSLPELRRTGRIVVASLAAGLAVFAVIALLTGEPVEAASFTDPEPAWLFVLGALSVLAILGLSVIGGLLISRSRARHAEASLSEAAMATEFHTFTLLRAALLEGVGFVGCVVFLVRGEALGLVVALGCLVGILWMVPTDARWRKFRATVLRSR